MHSHKTIAAQIGRYRACDPRAGAVTQIVVTLDRLLVALEEAAAADRARLFEAECHAVTRAHALLAGLDAMLDMQAGGSVAEGLRSSYHNAISALHALVRVADGAEGYDRLADGFRDLRGAWTIVGTTLGSPAPH